MQLNPHKLILQGESLASEANLKSLEGAKVSQAIAIERATWCQSDVTKKVLKELEDIREAIVQVILHGNANLEEKQLRGLGREAETIGNVINLMRKGSYGQ